MMPTATPYWWADAGAPQATEDQLRHRCDLLIIGAGYTGLNAAMTASDAGADVQVLERGIPGSGASSRNGGMFGAHPRFSVDKVASLYGRETALGIYAEAHQAEQYATNMIAAEQIDCDFQQTGRLQLAWTRQHFERQKKLVEGLQDVQGMTPLLLQADELGREINTQKYFGGICFPHHAALQPMKYFRGMLDAVQRRGVAVVSHCEVSGIDKSLDGFQVSTSQGDVHCQRLIVATNGYTQFDSTASTASPTSASASASASGNPSALRWLRRRVFPLPSYIIATEALAAERIAELAPGRRMMVETRARHSYFRISPDGTRILWGGRAAMVPIAPDVAARRLRASLIEVWPSLSDVNIEYSWTGNTGYTFSHLPQLACHEGIHFAAGFSGSGTVLAPYFGMKSAYQALGDVRGQSAYQNTRYKSPFWFRGGRPHFLQLADQWYHQVVDRRESAAARRDSDSR